MLGLKPADYILLTLFGLCLFSYCLAILRRSSAPVLLADLDGVEGFENPSSPSQSDQAMLDSILNEPPRTACHDIYDGFYAKIYDQLVGGDNRIKFEILDLKHRQLVEHDPSNVKLLDIGSSTGHHVALLQKEGYSAEGVDLSEAFVKRAQQKYPELSSRFQIGDVMRKDLFPASNFSHVALWYFTAYCFEDKDALFSNIQRWLRPGGGLVVHLVNRYKFDPVLEPASPFPAFSVQKYSRKRITKSKVAFDKFEYEADFRIEEPPTLEQAKAKPVPALAHPMPTPIEPEVAGAATDETATMTETFVFKDPTKAKRVHMHVAHMPTMRKCVQAVERAGFRFQSFTDMIACGYEYQYLFYFRKI
jgi:SAM-dependent methyltransferase